MEVCQAKEDMSHTTEIQINYHFPEKSLPLARRL